jgi:hypothetical protein
LINYFDKSYTGKSVQRTPPNNHFPVKDWMGVKGTERKHMRMSAQARLTMKKLVGFCMFRFLTTTTVTRRLPMMPS